MGDILEMMEFSEGKNTGNMVKERIIYMLENYTGLVEGYCILGTELVKEDIEGDKDA